MKDKKLLQFTTKEGRLIVALFDRKKWLVECPYKDIPWEIKKQVREMKEDGEILASMSD